MPDGPVRYVSQHRLRKLFNDAHYWDRVVDGDLFELVVWQKPAPKNANQPPETISKLSRIIAPPGEQVALVHYYEHPDGTVGASGIPDPKIVVVDGIEHKLQRN